MKTLLALAACVLISACSSKDNPANNNPINPVDTSHKVTPYFTCKINDTEFVASGIFYATGNSYILNGLGRFNGDSIMVQIISTKNGTGDVGFTSADVQKFSPVTHDKAKLNGTFTVSDTTHIIGTFSFVTLSGNRTITNGKFLAR